MSSNMYDHVRAVDDHIQPWIGFVRLMLVRGKNLFTKYNPDQHEIDSAEYPPQLMQWYHCRMKLPFACEGTAVHPNHHYWWNHIWWILIKLWVSNNNKELLQNLLRLCISNCTRTDAPFGGLCEASGGRLASLAYTPSAARCARSPHRAE